MMKQDASGAISDDHSASYLEEAASDLLRAIASKDIKLVAEALKSAFEICDSEPHEEGPHEGDEI